MNTKNNYISPRVESVNVELEQGIAAGSPTPTPNVDNTVEQSWDKRDDVNHSFDW